MVENSNADSIGQDNQIIKMKPILQQTSISGLTCETTPKYSTDVLKPSTILSKKSKKSNFDHSAIFMPNGCILQYEEANYIPKDVVISDDDLLKAQEIKLIEEEGHLLNNASIIINPLGIKSQSQRKDSISYFWLHQSVNNIKNSKHKDYNLSYENSAFSSKFFLIIFYIKELNVYKIRINPSFFKLLSKLVYFSMPKDIDIPLNTKELISFENMQFLITLKSNGVIELINNESSKKYIFSSLQISLITIGKSEECTISFPLNSLLSDAHVTISFSLNKRQWVIRDSSSDMTKRCWMLSDSPYPIYDGIVCKVASESFKIEIG